MKIGESVDVHTKYNDSWSSGFEIAAVVAEGYRVRRVSDGSLLPGFTSEHDIRASDERALMHRRRNEASGQA